MEEIPLFLIDDNPFNSRCEYDQEDIRALGDSLAQSGLLSPIKVRRNSERYQIVYGHRRVRAARLLGNNTIVAEVVSISDQEMLKLSLVENLARKNLSDYEKAKSFHRMKKDFGMSEEEIGRVVGFSRSHVCNYLRMLQLFDGIDNENDHCLMKTLHSISEHHARVLLQISDPKTRKSVLNLVVSESLSVRELSSIIHRLRGWFESDGDVQNRVSDFPLHRQQENQRLADKLQIERALAAEFELPHVGNFESFLDNHDFGSRFSIYSNFPPFERLGGIKGLEKERNWFYSVAPKLSAKIQNIHVQFFHDDVALSTLYVNYTNSSEGALVKMRVRGSVLFQKKADSWKIVHEHWSRLNQEGGILV